MRRLTNVETASTTGGFCQAVTADAMAAIGTAIGVETCSAAEQAENHSDGECVWVMWGNLKNNELIVKAGEVFLHNILYYGYTTVLCLLLINT